MCALVGLIALGELPALAAPLFGAAAWLTEPEPAPGPGVQPGGPDRDPGVHDDRAHAARRRPVREPAAGRARRSPRVTVLTGMARAGITIVDRLRVSGRQAVTDDLTGLGNRRHLLARLGDAISDTDARGRAAADRPRRLQGAQRHARSPRRRPGPAPDRPAPAGGAAARRHAGAARRRRVRGRARPWRRGVRQRRRPAAAGGARADVRRRRDPRAHRRQHRHRALPRARARRARPAPARRRRDVRGQAHAHRPRGLPARARPPQPAPARAARRAARRARRRPADPALPAEGRDRDRRRCAASRRSCAGRIRAAGC